jgi:hypothetical protein
VFGAPDPEIHFFLYWGYVTSRMPFPPLEDFAVSLAGPLVTWALGWGLLAAALLLPLRPAVALALATCAITQLVLVLVLYPALSVLGGWGDFVGIYRDAPRPASLATGAGYAASLLAFCWLMNRAWMRGFLTYPVPRPWRLRWVVGA